MLDNTQPQTRQPRAVIQLHLTFARESCASLSSCLAYKVFDHDVAVCNSGGTDFFFVQTHLRGVGGSFRSKLSK